jgi:Transposase DDE domain
MQQNQLSGMKVALQPAEESVPYEYWLSYVKNLALECVHRAHLSIHTGYKYTSVDFWKILLLHALMNLSLDDAADRLNHLLWSDTLSHQRNKKGPTLYQGDIARRERKCPNGDQVRKYRQTLAKWLVDKLNEFIFDCQLDYALTHHLISSDIDLIVDNTAQWYYGADTYPTNPFITKGYNGPGSNIKRNYLGVMIKSGTTYLYCGVAMIPKFGSNVTFITPILDRLIQKGFQIRYVIGDRWFPSYDLLAELDARGIYYLGPYRKWAPIRRAIILFLRTGKDYIFPYTIKGAPAKYYHKPGIRVWVILSNRRNRRLREIRKDFMDGTRSLGESVKDLLPMITSHPPPKGKKRCQGWARQICHRYDHRWQIESGFRDLNRTTPPSNARTNGRKHLMFSVRFWIFNAWQIERAKRKRLRAGPMSWRKGPTLRRFSRRVELMEACM